jgi:hypothetical protein
MKVIMNTIVEENGCPSSDQAQPKSLQLPSGGNVDLVWDGLLIREKE